MKLLFNVAVVLAAAVVAAPVSAYSLCRAQDWVAADDFAAAEKAGIEAQPALSTPHWVDPGPIVAVSAASQPAK